MFGPAQRVALFISYLALLCSGCLTEKRETVMYVKTTVLVMSVCAHSYRWCFVLFQAGLTQKWEAAGMSSMEGEYVEFGHAVYLEGPVEVSVVCLHLCPNKFINLLFVLFE